MGEPILVIVIPLLIAGSATNQRFPEYRMLRLRDVAVEMLRGPSTKLRAGRSG